MAGLDNNMLSVIECLAKNKIQDAKNAAIVCCKNDTTKKNAANLNYYQKLLENGNSTFMELPPNLQAYMSLEDVSGFREDRYYVGEKQQKLYDQILVGTKVSDRLMEYGISYHNSTLLYGVPGTGKTEFARYVAYKLGLPYAYLNFSNLIDSYMGKTAQNLSRIFDYCKGMKCVLMLDEIDCIGQAATNREDILDKALKRRFRNKVEFTKFNENEELKMIEKFVESIDLMEMDQELIEYTKGNHTQSETMDFLVEKLIQKVSKEVI